MTATAGDDATPIILQNVWTPDPPERTVTFERVFPGDDKPAGDVRLSISDQHADAFTRNEVVLRAEQRLSPVVKYGAWIPVSRDVLDDAPVMQSYVEGAFDRWLRPWRYADRNPMPSFVALPRLDRAHRRVVELHRRIVGMPQRLRDARYVLRHGLPETDW